MSFGLRETTIHGHRVAYRLAGSGPPIVLIHGITASSRLWELVGPRLARHHTVLTPDLLGHGETAKPRGDYYPEYLIEYPMETRTHCTGHGGDGG
jgi:pimeloyl-ACP methyl ester carboxylesterase